MNTEQWDALSAFKMGYKSYCDVLNATYHMLLVPLQREAAIKDTPEYPLENAVVYNTALDELTPNSDIRLIVITDNPGKDEQLNQNQKYLAGQSGKVANSFFASRPELGIDFRKNVIILNKTPVHSAKTKHLKVMAKASPEAAKIIRESQMITARMTANLHQALGCELWMVGYGELKRGGIFDLYKSSFQGSYASCPDVWKNVRVYQHFSMNCFAKDLKKYMEIHADLTVIDALRELGILHRDQFFEL